MILIFFVIFICSIIVGVTCVKSDSTDDNIFAIFVVNAIIFIISLLSQLYLVVRTENTTINTTTQKDSVIVKDSLLILNTNDTVRVFNINKL